MSVALVTKSEILQEKVLYALYIPDKTAHFSFKSGCIVQVMKGLKEDWFIVLW